MNSQLKGIILNHTLKSHTITPIESANVLRATMRSYGGFKYKRPRKRRDRLRKEKFLAKFRRDPFLVPIPFLKPGKTPTPVALGAPVQAAISTAVLTWAGEMVHEMEMVHDKCNCLAQETEETQIKRDKMSNWVCSLLDQRYDVKREIWKLEQDLNDKREELEQLKAEASGLRNAGPVVTSSVSWLSQDGASAESSTPKKKRKINKKDTLACPHKRGRSTISHI